MKKIKNLIFVCLFVVGCVGFTSADLAGYEIKDYQADFELTSSGLLKARERLDINFTEPRHGIYRDIPFKYPKSDYLLKTPISNVVVLGYDFSDFENGNDYRIKIGSPNYKVNGNQLYDISYEIRGAVREFTGYQELYWNMLGTNWGTKIENFNFSVSLPTDLELEPETEFYAVGGIRGSKDRVKLEKKGNKIQNAEPISLLPYEAITIAVKLPENYVPVEEFREEIVKTKSERVNPLWEKKLVEKDPAERKKDAIFQLIFFFVLFPGFMVWILLWYTFSYFMKGVKNLYRILTKRRTRVKNLVYYTPPKGFTVGEVATIYLKQAHYDSVFSTIYDRLAKGFIILEEDHNKKKDLIIRRKSIPSNLSNSELNLWKNFGLDKKTKILFKDFSRKKRAFSTYAKSAFNDIKYRLYTDDSVMKYTAGGVIVNDGVGKWGWLFALYLFGIIWLAMLSFFLNIIGPYLVLCFCVYAPIVYLGTKKPLSLLEYSEEGKEIYQQVLGFRKYLYTVEKEKLKTLLKDDPDYFDKMLPYAVAFGLGTNWVDKCRIAITLLPANESFGLDLNDRFFRFDRTFREMRHLREDWRARERASSSSSSRFSDSSDFGSSSGFDSDGGSSGGGGGGGGGGSR